MAFGAGGGVALSSQHRISSGLVTSSTSLSFQKYTNKYETALNNASNYSQASNQRISLGWEYKQFGLIGMARNLVSWTYANGVKNTFFNLAAISWAPTTSCTFSAGVSNTGNVLSPTQEDIELRRIDDNYATTFISTNYIF